MFLINIVIFVCMMTNLKLVCFAICILLLHTTTNAQSPFIFKIKTDNPGATNDSAFHLPAAFFGSNFDVDWNWDGIYDTLSVTSDFIIQYPSPGTYNISIRGSYPELIFWDTSDPSKLLEVISWGSQVWTRFDGGFLNCDSLTSVPGNSPDLSMVTDLSRLFDGAESFNSNINFWNTFTIQNMASTFAGASSFNQPLNFWYTGGVNDMTGMFSAASSFNQNINNWDVSSVNSMAVMFGGTSSFNQPLDMWDVSNVNNMTGMFVNSSLFNQNINTWNVSSVTDMSTMFSNAKAYNQPLDMWDVSSVTNMSFMFSMTDSFNQDISNWNVSSVTNMSGMFENTEVYNQPLNSWDVSSVNRMTSMFSRSDSFNQPLDSWNIALVTNFQWMFEEARAFNQPLDSWDFSSAMWMFSFLDSSNLSTTNYDSLLIHLSNNHSNQSLSLGAEGLTYCLGSNARNNLISNGWNFIGDTIDSGCQIVNVAKYELNSIEELDLYPNPCRDGVIRVSLNLSNHDHLKIFNDRGKLVYEAIPQSEEFTLDSEQLKPGIYFVRYGQFSKKLILL